MCEACGSSPGCGIVYLDGIPEAVCIHTTAFCEACDERMIADARIVYKGLKIHDSPECRAIVDAGNEI